MNRFEFFSECALRFSLFSYYIVTTYLTPRRREIHDEEWWLYMNPVNESYIPYRFLIAIVVACLLLFPLTATFTNKKRYHSLVVNAILGYTLATLLDLTVTNTLKLLVGRPRPDFFNRCFPDGKKLSSLCTGDENMIIEGLKSFPSGHSSLSMSAFGFISLFLVAQFRLFAKKRTSQDGTVPNGNNYCVLNEGSYSGCKFLVAILPLLGGIMVCVSRLMDFHHHYDDIISGALIGLLIAFATYRLYFVSIFHKMCDVPRYEYDLDKIRRCGPKNDSDFRV